MNDIFPPLLSIVAGNIRTVSPGSGPNPVVGSLSSLSRGNLFDTTPGGLVAGQNLVGVLNPGLDILAAAPPGMKINLLFIVSNDHLFW